MVALAARLAGVPMGSATGLWCLDLDIDRMSGEMTGSDSFAKLNLQMPAHRARTSAPAAVAAGLGEKETLATLRSGISAGAQHPRQRRARP